MQRMVRYFEIKECSVCKKILSKKPCHSDTWIYKDKIIIAFCTKECKQQRPVLKFISCIVKISC